MPTASSGPAAASTAASFFGLITHTATAQGAIGGWFSTVTHGTDTGYNLYVVDEGPSTGGTNYGLYIDLTDTHTTRYGIY